MLEEKLHQGDGAADFGAVLWRERAGRLTPGHDVEDLGKILRQGRLATRNAGCTTDPGGADNPGH